jgi:membrane protein DedA with SNARE-associated domain
MNTVFQFVLQHGYSILFAAVFARQIGLPVPAPLFLLAAGALAASGKLGLVTSFGLAVIACVLADWVWYEAGRRRGDEVLHFIHRLTRDPDYHDRRAKETFARYGVGLLLIAKFVPGLDAVAPPLAGTSSTSRLRFLAFETVGACLWSCAYAGLGYAFSHDLDRAAAYAGRVGTVFAGLAFAALSVYVVRKLVLRHRFASDLRRGRAFIQVGVATVKRQIASALIRDWPLVAYFPLPWPTICTTCDAQGKRTNPWGD